MPRTARKQGRTGYYHIITRGNAKQIIFEDDKDYSFYIYLISKFSKEMGVVINAYCLMDNHVHLLVYDPEFNISQMMKKIDVTYAKYYNEKYDRVGHLFQGRFLSEKIDNESYLLTAFRYILQNPEVAGVAVASEYMWSSYRYYGTINTFVDTDIFVGIIGDWEKYAKFISEKCNDRCMEFETISNDDEWALTILRTTIGMSSGSSLQTLNKHERDKYILKLREKGLSINQISRFTGLNRNIVQRAK